MVVNELVQSDDKISQSYDFILLGLELLKLAIEKAGYTDKIEIGMDIAASEFCKEGFKYDLDFKNPKSDPATWVSNVNQANYIYVQFPILSAI